MKKSDRKCLIKLSFLLQAMLCVMSCSTARKVAVNTPSPGIDIVFSGSQVADTVYVTAAPIPTDTNMFIKDYLETVRTGETVAYPVVDRKVHVAAAPVASVYNLKYDIYSAPSVYMRGGDHIDIDVQSLSPVRNRYSGADISRPIPRSEEFYQLRSKLFKISRYKLTEQELDSLSNAMRSLLDVMMAEADPETATRIVSMLEEDFAPYAFERLPAGSENTLHYAHACAMRNTGARAESAQEQLQQSLSDPAATPGIQFTDLVGETFDITSLRGKVVVIDFWTTWCGPCRKGFESMKKIYAAHSDKLEVVAIACGDHEEVWRQVIADLELPWQNYLLPAPSDEVTVAGFPVSSYPTKVIIDADGILKSYSIGEDDDFYITLLKMLK